MADCISSSTPSTVAYPATTEGASVSQPGAAAPMQAEQDSSPYNDVTANDPFLQSKQALERHAPSPPRQESSREAGAPPMVSVRDLQSQRSAPGQASLRDLAGALSKPDVFDESTCEDSKGLGTQLNVSFFDRGAQKTGFYKDLAGMLDDPAKTRATLSKSLAHLPPDVRGEAVDAIMDKVTNKLCGKIQDIMKRDVNAAAATAKATLEPYCGDDPSARAKLMHNIIETTPALSRAQISRELQGAGLSSDDAKSLASGLIKAKADPAQRAAIGEAARGGDLSSEQWSKGYVTDGAVRNLSEDLQAAFEDTSEHIDLVVTQMSSDASRGDATFTNPLFERAKHDACAQLGISLKDGSGSARAIHGKIDDQKFVDTRDAVVSTLIMGAASMAVPAGLVAGLVTGAIASAPGVMVAQDNLDASRGGVVTGTNDEALVSAQKKNRNDAIDGAVLGWGWGLRGRSRRPRA